MSISPLKSNTSQSNSSGRSSRDRLTLSQALLITAGLAGLVGLCSGAIIRFSLSNSDGARFLSPLQTFPALSNWSPELPQGTAEAHYLPDGTSLKNNDNLQESSRIQTFKSRDEEQIDGKQILNRFDPSTFDTFANRASDAERTVDPFKTLQNGPTTLDQSEESVDRPKHELPKNGSTNPADEYYGDNYPGVEEPLYDDGTYYEGQGQEQW